MFLQQQQLRAQGKVLKGNLAFMPFSYFFNIIGFDLLKTKKDDNKISRFAYSTLLLLSIILSMSLLSNDFNKEANETATNIVVGTITCINNRCIKFTFIIIYVSNMMMKIMPTPTSLLSSIFQSFENIDKNLQNINNNSYNSHNKKHQKQQKQLMKSKSFVKILMLILFMSTFCRFIFESSYNKTFNVGHFFHVILVFILSVKILFYIMICASIKVRFIALHECLRKRKSNELLLATTKATCKGYYYYNNNNVKRGPDVKMVTTISNNLKEISLIFDEVLHIILQMNDSFSILLTFVFGSYYIYHWIKICVWEDVF